MTKGTIPYVSDIKNAVEYIKQRTPFIMMSVDMFLFFMDPSEGKYPDMILNLRAGLIYVTYE